jgi:hypothetical protein
MTIITKHPIIDSILEIHKTDLGKDYHKYRNHVYRLYHLSLDLYRNELTQNIQGKFAVAAAFRDLGIWTAQTFDYLSPSIELAKKPI